MTKTRWEDWLITAVGIVIMAAPLILAATVPGGTPLVPMIGFIATGLVVAALGTFSLNTGERWEEYLTAIAGLWLLAMPWGLSFQSLKWLMWASVIAGAALIVLAAMALRDMRLDAEA